MLISLQVLRTNQGNSFGASLSYASHDGTYGVETPQILSNTMIPDNSELVLLSDNSCDDEKCGYTRPGGLAYRKLFHHSLSST